MQKIDSEEAYFQWSTPEESDTALCWYASNTAYTSPFTHTQKVFPLVPWWMLRERIRVDKGIYESTLVLDQVNKHHPICAHVSVLDRSKVAYTPDAFAGKSDKQLQTTIQKLLYKFCPYFTESHIQELAGVHESCLNPDVRMFNGWDLTDLYISNFDGLGACMSSKKYTRDTHPTIAYHTPHIHVACLYSGKQIIARSLVYENGSDKRYFRVYGSSTLTNYLERKGYKSSNWHQVSFNTVKHSTNNYLFPYLDAFNGRGVESNSSVALIDGIIVGVPQTTHPKAARVVPALSTSGILNLTNIKSTDLLITDAITGFVYDVFNCPIMFNVWINGQPRQTAHVPDYFINLGRTDVHPDECVRVDDRWKLKDAVDLSSYKQLDPVLYPDRQHEYFSYGVVVTVSGKNVHQSDATKVFDRELKVSYYHRSEFNSRSFVRTKDNTFVTKDTPYLVTTSKTKVVPGLHTYCTLVTGEHVIRRPKAQLYVFGKQYYFASFEQKETWITENKANLMEDVLRKSKLNCINWARNVKLLGDKYGYLNEFETPLNLLKQTKKTMTEPKTVSMLNAYIAELEAIEAPHYLYP